MISTGSVSVAASLVCGNTALSLSCSSCSFSASFFSLKGRLHPFFQLQVCLHQSLFLFHKLPSNLCLCILAFCFKQLLQVGRLCLSSRELIPERGQVFLLPL